MSYATKEKLKGAIIVPLGILIVLVPFSFLIGWNLLTLLIFWFVFIPFITLYLPPRISKNKNHLFESLVGLIVFYGFMVLMIYKQYQTDYFKVMIASLVINLMIVVIVSVRRNQQIQAKKISD